MEEISSLSLIGLSSAACARPGGRKGKGSLSLFRLWPLTLLFHSHILRCLRHSNIVETVLTLPYIRSTGDSCQLEGHASRARQILCTSILLFPSVSIPEVLCTIVYGIHSLTRSLHPLSSSSKVSDSSLIYVAGSIVA